jgi:hypothetical protein
VDPIPDSEWQLYFATVAEAVTCARLGCAAVGFRLLEAGRRRACGLEGVRQPWGEALARRYREAADRYAARHGDSLLQ